MLNNICKNIGFSLNDSEKEYLGGMCYIENSNSVQIERNEISRTYGQGSIRITNCKNIEINKNDISNTFYRGISIYNTKDDLEFYGTISHNIIKRCGYINNTNSGIGCDGIFVQRGISHLTINNNNVKDVYENGIEGIAEEFCYNIVENTGVDLINHPTPSSEGIFVSNNVRIKTIVKGNIVKNPERHGIYTYSKYDIENITYLDNDIEFNYKSNNYGIYLLSENNIKNIDFKNNKVINSKCAIECDYKSIEEYENINQENNLSNTDIFNIKKIPYSYTLV